jgi:glycerophosphoryl diester phosphodiesterase
MKRVGHGGASALFRANTFESFDAAVEIGIDIIEFDVRGTGHGELVLAHTRLDLRRRGCPTLEAALRYLCGARFDGIGLNLDLKTPGCEAAVVDALQRFGVADRALVSSQIPSILDGVREHDPSIVTGISIGGRVSRLGQRWGDWRRHALAGIASGRFRALMAQHKLIDAHLVEAVKARRGELYGWTVNDHGTLNKLRAVGVDGLVTNDPRLFALAQPLHTR